MLQVFQRWELYPLAEALIPPAWPVVIEACVTTFRTAFGDGEKIRTVLGKSSYRHITPRTVMMLRRSGLQAPRRFRCLCAAPGQCGTAGCPCFERGAKCNAHCHATSFACSQCVEPKIHPTLGFTAQTPVTGQAPPVVVDVVSDDEVWTGAGGGGRSEEAEVADGQPGKRKPTAKRKAVSGTVPGGEQVQESPAVHIKVEQPARKIPPVRAATPSRACVAI